jgi:hypothetical protein
VGERWVNHRFGRVDLSGTNGGDQECILISSVCPFDAEGVVISMTGQGVERTKVNSLLVQCAVSVLLCLVPGGAYAGLLLAVLTTVEVGTQPELRKRPGLLVAAVLVLGVTGLWAVRTTMELMS